MQSDRHGTGPFGFQVPRRAVAAVGGSAVLIARRTSLGGICADNAWSSFRQFVPIPDNASVSTE